MNANGDPPEKRARKSRWRTRVAAVLGGLAVLIAAWFTEVPQERVADWTLERFFGSGVQIEYGSVMGGKLHIESLAVFSTIDELGPPVVQLTDIVVDYNVVPEEGRRIHDVRIGSLAVRLDAIDPEHPNFAFLEPLLTSEGPPPPASVMPKFVKVDNISVVAAGTPPGAIDGQPFHPMGISISALSADVEHNGKRVTRAVIYGDDVTTTTWVDKAANTVKHDGGRYSISYSGTATHSRLRQLWIAVPGLLEVNCEGERSIVNGITHDIASVITFNVLGASFQSDDMPVVFDSIDATGAAYDSEASWNMPVAVKGLRIGSIERPMYNGDLQLDSTGEAEGDIELAVNLNEGQRIDASIDPGSGSAVASIDAWTPEMLSAAVPPAYRDRLAELPDFDAFSITVAASAPDALKWFDTEPEDTLPFDFSVFGDATLPQASKDDGLRIEAAGNGAWSENGLDSAHAQGGIVIAGERATFDVGSGAEKPLVSNVSFDDVKIARWLKLALGDIPVGSDSGTLNGTLAYDGETGSGDLTLSRGNDRVAFTAEIAGGGTDDAPLRVTAAVESGGNAQLSYEAAGDEWNGAIDLAAFDLGRLARLIGFEADIAGTATGKAKVLSDADAADGEASLRLDGVRSDDWSLHPEGPIEVVASFEADPDFRTVQGGVTNVSLDGETVFALDSWDWTQDPWLFNASAHANLDLEKHGKAIGIEGWAGQAQASFSIEHRQDRWRAPARVLWNDPTIPGLEDVQAGPISFTGDLARQPGSTATTLTDGVVDWGEHMHVKLPHASVETSPFGVLGEVDVDTDLTILIALGLLGYVDGEMNALGEVRLVDGNPQFDLTLDGTIAALELPESMAAVGGAKLAGQVTYNGEYGGAGAFSAVSAASAGALLTEIAGGYTFTGDRLSISDTTGKLYGGDVQGQGQVELLTGTYNGEFEAGIARLDLDRFTKEYQPGEFRVTGIANGDAYARWSTEGLSGARFFLTSTEGFTLDRETVETLLTTGAIPDQWGMRWIRNRINKKMIGDDPQRPFDSAKVDLELRQTEGEPDRLLGPITLKSETLDLNIEWAVDVEAIYSAMESDLAAVENFSTGTVQSEDQ